MQKKSTVFLLILFFLSASAVAEYCPSVVVFDSKEAQGRHCAQEIVSQILQDQTIGKRTVLGLATGSTPIPVYEALISLVKEQGVDLSTVITFNLDEYLGLSPSHPQSYHAFMFEHLFQALLSFGLKSENIHIPNGLAADAEEYERLLQQMGPTDIQILGIGTNGHIGFAEPGSSFSGATQIVKLSENTRRDNARFFHDDLNAVPEYAVTMGIGTILRAKKIILLASGPAKAAIIDKTLHGPISEEVPATALRLHPNAVFFLDESAAGALP